jgi:hypothetical protein
MELTEYAESSSCYFCGWSDDGLNIIIRNPHEFVRQVLPKFFKGGVKFTSFQRKLYRWGFRVVTHFWKHVAGGDEVIVYRADLFQRGRPDLLQNMRSMTAQKSKKQDATGPERSLRLFFGRGLPGGTGVLDRALVNSLLVISASSAPAALTSHIEPLEDRVSLADFKNPTSLADEAKLASLSMLFDLEPNPVVNLSPPPVSSPT